MNSCACARRAACSISSRGGRRGARRRCSRRRSRRTGRVVADDRDGLAQRARSTSRTSAPSSSTAPAAGVVQPRDQRDEARLARAGGPTSATVRPAGTSRSMSLQHRARLAARAAAVAPARWRRARRGVLVAQRDVAQLHVPVAGGSGGAPGASVRCGSRSSSWKMRAPEAVARWARLSVTPSERIGVISMFRYR